MLNEEWYTPEDITIVLKPFKWPHNRYLVEKYSAKQTDVDLLLSEIQNLKFCEKDSTITFKKYS